MAQEEQEKENGHFFDEKELEQELENEPDQEPSKFWTPIRIILALFLMLLMVLWIIPSYGIKMDPSPARIPKISEVIPTFPDGNMPGNETLDRSSSDFRNFVQPSNPLIKGVATKIVSNSCDNSRVCHAKALFYFVRDNLKYVRDPIGKEYVESGLELLENGGGDCESGSILLASLMEAVGIDAQLVLIQNHAYLRINLPEAKKRYKLDEDWVYLDWTCRDCNFGEIPWQNIRRRSTFLEVP